MARKFFSEITINSRDEWIFRGNEIHQEEILKYFRANLKEDEDGVYIKNVFGELEEFGYIEINGYPLHIIRVTEEGGTLFFSSDADLTLEWDDIQIFTDPSENLILKKKGESKIFYRLNSNAGGQLSEWILESGESFEIKHHNETIPILRMDHTTVEIPVKYIPKD
ncbi:MAG: hypothetical protein GW938_02510 [Leptospira sp.]|jgi:hypothetical protein|nr:hypothetical protein [Leptospira sp.]NCS94251.1 hypothetical protein [Leptospira sp.]